MPGKRDGSVLTNLGYQDFYYVRYPKLEVKTKNHLLYRDTKENRFLLIKLNKTKISNM